MQHTQLASAHNGNHAVFSCIWARRCTREPPMPLYPLLLGVPYGAPRPIYGLGLLFLELFGNPTTHMRLLDGAQWSEARDERCCGDDGNLLFMLLPWQHLLVVHVSHIMCM